MDAGLPSLPPLPDPDDVPAEATVLRMLLGAQLRRLRESAGISAEQAAYPIRASRSKISRMETGRVGFKLRDVEDLLTLYGVTDGQQRTEILALARRSSAPDWWARYGDILPGWFETYLGLESAATTIRSFEVQFVPGLFQTEDYARAVTELGHHSAADTEIDRRVALRARRQELLTRPAPPAGLGGHRRGRAAPPLRRPSRSSRSPAAATPAPAGPSRSCGSPSVTCPTWSTSSSSPAPSTSISAPTSSTTWKSSTSSAARP